jgi:hypothetical protein
MEAARVFPTIWSCHMLKGSASDMESGIIMKAAMVGATVNMAPI